MSWASERLAALKAGTVELMPVVKTLQLGGLHDWASGWVRKVWEPRPELLQSDGTMFGGYLAALAD
jgi:acyl-coenzyme A thioesterase PaaI-like protein